MKSRMERYYEVDTETSRRTRKNADLYQKIYENDEYSNIEGIATTLKPNEIDISKIKELLKTRDDSKKERVTRTISKPLTDSNMVDNSFEQDDDKSYDIRDILTKAKSERKEPAKKTYHKIDVPAYDTLKSSKKELPEDEEEELKELIHTITNTSMLNKLGDQELSLGLLDELKSDTMVGDSSAIRKALEEEKKVLKDDNFLDDENDDKKNMDQSFFTSNLNFKDEDFEELQEMSKNIKKNDKVMNILIFILLVIFTTCVIFWILK